jgi:hypothetical protein
MEARAAAAGQGKMPGLPGAAGTAGQGEGGHLAHLRQSEKGLDQGAAAQAAAMAFGRGEANGLIQAGVQACNQLWGHKGRIHLQLRTHHHRKRRQYFQGKIAP